MVRVAKPMRGRRPGKRLDLTDIKEALRDDRTWNGLGVVMDPGDGTEHYEIVTDDSGAAVDIVVEVELMPDGIPLTCRMSGFAGGAGAGIWTIPAIGDEVAVMIPRGEIAWMPMIIGVLSSRSVPNPTGTDQGPAPARTIIVNHEVFIHDGTGNAEPLIRKSDFDGHTHPPGSFAAPSGGGPVTGVSGGAANAVGTSCLKAM